MSILTNTNQPQQLTLEQKQAAVAGAIKRTAAANYQQLVRIQKEGIRTVWNNPQGLTPQQVCDALGADAVKVFDIHGILTDAIVQIAGRDGVAPDVALPKKTFTRNQDGTITILETDYGT